MQGSRGSGILGYLALFTSFGTLLCCALPLLFVLLGLGATVASVVSSAGWPAWALPSWWYTSWRKHTVFIRCSSPHHQCT